MRKYSKVLVLSLCVIFILSVISSVSFAKSPMFVKKNFDRPFDKDFIAKKAEQFGIKTEGKTEKQIMDELLLAKLSKVSKELSIATEGKTVQQLQKEIMDAKLLKKAKELGIKTDGKTTEQIAAEVRKQMIIKKATELGISTAGKTTEQLLKEIKEKAPPKFDRKPFGKFKGFEKRGFEKGQFPKMMKPAKAA